MDNTYPAHQRRHVSSWINQTYLVEQLLRNQSIPWDDLRWENPDESAHIYQWLAFNHFSICDYDRLVEAGIPVLQTELGEWVGITSFGSPYELYVYPELIEALFLGR